MELNINGIPIPMLAIKDDHKIHVVNKSCCDLFGYTAQELIGQDLSILLPKNIHSVHKKWVAEYFKALVAKRLGIGRDLYGLRKDGDIVPIEIGLYPFGEHVLATMVDITTGRNYAISSTGISKAIQLFKDATSPNVE